MHKRKNNTEAPATSAQRTWVLVVDRNVVRLFRQEDGNLRLIGESETEMPPSPSGARVAKPRRPDIYSAQELSLWLNDSLKETASDRLILVAAPDGGRKRKEGGNVYTHVLADLEQGLPSGLGNIPRHNTAGHIRFY